MLKIRSCTEEPGGADALSGLWSRVKILHSGAACFKIWVEMALPLTGVLLPYLVFEYSRLCNFKKTTEN